MVMRKVPIRVVQQILGHSDIRLTMRYAHVGDESLAQAVDAIGEALGAGTPVTQALRKATKKD
jgi:hypothetical protein